MCIFYEVIDIDNQNTDQVCPLYAERKNVNYVAYMLQSSKS